ncbi:MAG: CsgG/HfaB family protein [Treponema sp.]|jgi:TolB-like protein|nr:CsgG/HfaB family protein [Treponema sp.]
MKKLFCVVVTVFLLGIPLYAQNGTLDEGIRQITQRVADKLIAQFLDEANPVSNRKIAVINIESDSDKLSDYIINHLTAEFINNKISVVERNSEALEKAHAEQIYQASGAVNDSEAQSIGNELGVGYIITGAFRDVDKRSYELSVRAVNVESMGIGAIEMIIVSKADKRIAGLLTDVAETKRRKAERERRIQTFRQNHQISTARWSESLFNYRLYDVPQIGFFWKWGMDYRNMFIRLSSPISLGIKLPYPPLILSYESSFFGIGLEQLDFTFGFNFDKTKETSKVTLADEFFFRVMNMSIWGGVPFGGKGGIYALFEFTPAAVGAIGGEDFSVAFGFSGGLRFTFSKYISLDARFEYYALYDNIEAVSNYLGVFLNHKIFGARNDLHR